MTQSNYQLLYKTGISFCIALLFKILFFRLPEVLGFDVILISIMVLFIWEGNLKIDQWLNNKNPWLNNPKKRLLQQSVAFTLFTSVTLFLVMFILHQIKFRDGRLINRKMAETFFPGLFFALALIAVYISYQFFTAWKQSVIDVEKYKTESANAQLQNLKNQLNPHFLFNNLSVLSSLVYTNQDKAVDFINELSKVYRYVLDNKSAELVTLREELDFLNHYIYLLKIRFEASIIFTINVDEIKMKSLLPPMCLQMLVENTIQHNEASKANPLQVSIYTNTHSLIIENTVLPRSDVAESSKTGLKNIQSRYTFFTSEKVDIIVKEKTFKVVLPLIDKL